MVFFHKKKKEKICPKCNEPKGQGHRCNTSKLHKIKHDRLYVRRKYEGLQFETLETPNSFVCIMSGAELRYINGKKTKRIIGMDEYKQSIQNIISACQKKLSEIPN